MITRTCSFDVMIRRSLVAEARACLCRKVGTEARLMRLSRK